MSDEFKNYLYAFVILHYCAIEDTIKCVESIKQYCHKYNYIIVIVDNGSYNQTGYQLKEKYKNERRCTVILNDKNLGFAKGNNVGFMYAKKAGADFICVMNSDTYLMDECFIPKSVEDYRSYEYYVLGPNIYTPDVDNQSNPMGNHILSYTETSKKIFSLRIQILLCIFNLSKLGNFFRRRNEKKKIKFERDKYYENVKLHGSCWVFSPMYVNKYNGINPHTFLYLEEDLLYIEMMQNGNKTLYSPKVRIFHSEDASTNYVIETKSKQLFVLRNHLKSMKVIHSILKRK